jgi:hypothetical protein
MLRETLPGDASCRLDQQTDRSAANAHHHQDAVVRYDAYPETHDPTDGKRENHHPKMRCDSPPRL